MSHVPSEQELYAANALLPERLHVQRKMRQLQT